MPRGRSLPAAVAVFGLGTALLILVVFLRAFRQEVPGVASPRHLLAVERPLPRDPIPSPALPVEKEPPAIAVERSTKDGRKALSPGLLPDREREVLKKQNPGKRRSQDPMMFYLERELHLTVDQRRHFLNVLADREKEIESLHERIRQDGVLVRSDYTLRLEEIRRRHFLRMSETLRSAQNRRWEEILHEGGFGDGVEFEHPAGLVVVD